MPDELIATDGDTQEAVTVEETVETANETFARVQGETFDGWVEL